MRRPAALLAISAALVLGACEQAELLLPADQLDCAGAEPDLCQRMARVAIAQMNVAATGPITLVVLQPVDCERIARSSFLGDLSGAVGCWVATVTGERSHGGGTIVLWPDGSLKPYW
jgi:hypothetical protein